MLCVALKELMALAEQIVFIKTFVIYFLGLCWRLKDLGIYAGKPDGLIFFLNFVLMSISGRWANSGRLLNGLVSQLKMELTSSKHEELVNCKSGLACGQLTVSTGR